MPTKEPAENGNIGANESASAGTAAGNVPETSSIFRLISRVRQILRTSWVATGLGLTVALGLGMLLIASLVDLAVPLWTGMRVVALVLVVVPAAWALALGVLRPLFRRLGNRLVARRIETHLPGIHNRLVSCVDLAANGRREGYSLEFYRRLVDEALARIASFKPATVLDRRSLRRALSAAAVVVGAFLLAWVLLADRLPVAMARIFSPLADIPPATGVEFTVRPGNARLLRGDDINFSVAVTKGTPRDLRIELMSAKGGPVVWHELFQRRTDRWTRTLRGFEHTFSYRVHGGGTWSRKYRVTLVERPRIVELASLVHYPDYLGPQKPHVTPRQASEITGPETSQVEVRARVLGSATRGEIQLLQSRLDTVAVVDRDERIWFDGKLPEGALAEGNWQWDTQLHARNVHTEPAADGLHGHLFHTAAVGFKVQPGEHLFADVFISAEQRPQAISLHWHDGQDWEHRAYWGDDVFTVGQNGTPSRFSVGPLPESGKWVRLEVPAKAVGLEGRELRGMAFSQFGGHCAWHVAGAWSAPTRQEQHLVVAERFPLKSGKRNWWKGRFPLVGDGWFRVELKNELGHANQTMKELHYIAIPDQPPQVTLERPGTDLVLSQPRNVPLVIGAYDDFGLKNLKLLVQRGETGGFREAAVKRYEKLVRGDHALLSLELTGLDLKPGDTVRYRVAVQDRKEQIAETQDFAVRIAADENAVDRQLARFEQAHDTFQERLVQLIAEQAKVRETTEKLDANYTALEDKLEAAEAQAKALAEAQPVPEGQPAPQPQVQLDPETTQALAELRQQLQQLAAQEDQQAAIGQQLSTELTAAVEQLAQTQVLPPELVEEMAAAQQAFDQMAAKPMQELAGQFRQASDGSRLDPQLEDLSQFSDRLQQELEAAAERLAALDKARSQVGADMEQALAELRQELARQQADDAARGIGELEDLIAALTEQLKELEGEQAELLDATEVVPDRMLDELAQQQGEFEIESEPPLDEAQQLLAQTRQERAPRRPEFPDEPELGEFDEYLVPQAEEDSPAEAEAEDEQAAEADDAEGEAAEEEEEEEPLFMPALGGPQPKLDPRFADKRPPPAPKPGQEPADADAQERQELASRQFNRLEELNLTRQSLASDQQQLAKMLERLQQAMAEGETPEELMQSAEMQEALAMAQRLHQAAGQQAAGQPQQPAGQPPQTAQTPKPHGRSFGLLRATTSRGKVIDAELAALDPASRGMILKMQPRLREELLQGMREQGPEGYRRFIQDYFQRLTTIKDASAQP